ncbi:LolA family protein [Kitasatospora viridis]|uniref:Outer membrane lipoprotein-sorting protein n=1 Tax=Kitasatospora viridis TaxID=281105 RepID=A0A561UG42_9ACTN|nr:DUF2092 domain-containing protein [Kitasatospora viridis]TWF98333.1 outer membrane lipoprotein-sorting protein [Kitasatospora viridis]
MTQYAGFDDQRDGVEPAGGAAGSADPAGIPYRAGRRTAMRLLVPVAVVAAAATAVAVVPALASDSAPQLPKLTAEQLVTKVLSNQTQALSGTVQVSTDLGIPSELVSVIGQGGGAAGVAGTAGQAGGSGQSRQWGGSSANPTSQLTGLLSGSHTLRVAVDGPDKQRVALVEDLAEYDLVHNGTQAWSWDSGSQQAVHYTGLRQGASGDQHQLPGDVPATPQQAAQQLLAGSATYSDVSVSGTATVAGRSAYQLSVRPKQSGSTIGEVRIAIDSATGTPLAVTALGTGGGTILDSRFSQVSFGHPGSGTFDFTPPKGAKVTQKAAGLDKPDTGKAGEHHTGDQAGQQAKVIGEGWTAVLSAQLPAELNQTAPAGGKQDGGKQAKGLKGLGSPMALLKSFGKPVGGGTLISSKVINVLITDDNRVYAGAVTLQVLQSAAGVK